MTDLLCWVALGVAAPVIGLSVLGAVFVLIDRWTKF
jgi:hypothetical protein